MIQSGPAFCFPASNLRGSVPLWFIHSLLRLSLKLNCLQNSFFFKVGLRSGQIFRNVHLRHGKKGGVVGAK